MGDCTHERIQTWRDMETGASVGLWSCVACDRKFVPMPDASAQEAQIARLREALENAQRAINSMKVEAETSSFHDEESMREACELISQEGLEADTAIRAALKETQ